jgi:DNA polymerase I-like protein with 3'-5' exonuclease and polymerase domains
MTHGLWISLDVETTLNGNSEVGLAHPMHPLNKVVMSGFKYCAPEIYLESDRLSGRLQRLFRDAPVVVCGCNISFDLLYLYTENPEFKSWVQSKYIWDIQLAEYIITGQRSKFASLDELSSKYGLPLKDDKIKKYFEAGLGADKIPKEELEPYLVGDLNNTLEIAKQQFAIATKQNQLNLIASQMQALHATIEMMFNGLSIDKHRLDQYTVEVVNSFVTSKLDLESLAAVEDINSPKQWSQYFFGGTKKTKERELVGLYKNGKNKYKLVDKETVIPAKVTYVPDKDKVSEKTGQVSVDDTVLLEIAGHTSDAVVKTTVEKLLAYREVSKQLSTYVTGLSNHIICQPIGGEYIYGKLNHTATVTGRLSSTSPNLQNISNNPIKQIFKSRFEDGYLVEFDFNQLEVVALAHVTRDEQLIYDISNGVDIHSALYKDLFGKMPTKEERKPFKARTFQLIYGAGAKAISKSAGCPLDEAKRFIDVFYARYPGVARWHVDFLALVEKFGLHQKSPEGVTDLFATYEWQSETGRKFVFKEYENNYLWSAKKYSYSPTELKNYPIQGLATGDIVPMMLGVIFDKIKEREDVKMVNTIHDSILFDVEADSIVEFVTEIEEVLENTHKYFEKTFQHPLALKLKAGVSFGRNWFDMKEV